MVLLTDSGWPTYTNDSGPGTNGTIGDEDFFNDFRDAIDSLCHSLTNPTLTPADLIDEVVTARGSEASLDDRLSEALNPDGTLKTQATLVSVAQSQTFIGAQSLARNDDLTAWSGGGSAAPDNFTLTGAGATVARTGSGEGDTFTFGAGRYAVKVTSAGAEAKLTQDIIASADFGFYTEVKGRKVAFACKCKASVPSLASIVCDDGVTTTRGGSTGNGTYHPGDGNTAWIYGVHTISNSATKLSFYADVASSGSAYFGGFVFLWSDIAPSDWIPFSVIPDATSSLRGLVSTGSQTFAGAKAWAGAASFQSTLGVTGAATFDGAVTVKGGTSATYCNVGGRFYSDVTQHAVGTSQTDVVMTDTTIPANMLSATGKVVHVYFGSHTADGGTGQKQTEIDIGGTQVVCTNHTTTDTFWHVEVRIIRINSNTVSVSTIGWASSGGDEVRGVSITGLDFTAAIALRTLGTTGGSSSALTQDYFWAEAKN